MTETKCVYCAVRNESLNYVIRRVVSIFRHTVDDNLLSSVFLRRDQWQFLVDVSVQTPDDETR